MAEIRPFRALRYRPDLDLAAVTCPPYDVLSAEERAALAARSPNAAVRIILPEGDGDARYDNAADLLHRWQQEGILREDPEPALYVTRTEFIEPGVSGARRTRFGLITLLRLHDYADRVILPHERTLSAPKADRLRMQTATRANIESIFGLVDDPDRHLASALAGIAEQPPLSRFVADDGQVHTLWAVTDPERIAEIAASVAAEPVFIADGHHRYETAVAYAREHDALGTDRPEAFLLATLTWLADPGLCVLPTHRLIRGTPADVRNTLFARLNSIFEMQLDTLDDVESRLRISIQNQLAFGLILHGGEVYRMIVRDASQIDSLLPAEVPVALKHLEAVILQYLVLDRALGIPADQVATTDRIAYTRDASEALERVDRGEFDMAFLLGRPSVTAVRDVSLAGEVMPQKSTFFYPKLLSGLVMRRID